MTNQIVKWMVLEGTKNTLSGSYCFYLDEISDKFNLKNEEIRIISEEILEKLKLKEEVADCNYGLDESFYIVFYLAYCGIEVEVEEDYE